MRRRHRVDATLRIGACVDPDLETAEREMLVLKIEPAIALLEELGLLAGPELLDNPTGLVAQDLAVFPDHGNLLRTTSASFGVDLTLSSRRR